LLNTSNNKIKAAKMLSQSSLLKLYPTSTSYYARRCTIIQSNNVLLTTRLLTTTTNTTTTTSSSSSIPGMSKTVNAPNQRGKAVWSEASGISGNKHKSNAEQLIAKQKIIVVKGTVAQCDGGGGALGHPVEYIQLETRKDGTPSVCKYCGLTYKKDPDFHGGH
jgi:uncharacterized Zn-finger protein